MSADSPGKPVSKAAIVNKAVELMEQRGLAAVSLRRIATELGISAPTLYWHISGKRELLDAVAEQLLRRGLAGMDNRPAEGQPWWEWLEQRCSAMFRAMLSVPDAPQVVAGNRPTPETLPDIEAGLAELVAVGFTAAEAQQVFLVLGGYITGMALEWQSEAAREVDTDVNDHELGELVRDPARFPYLAAAVRGRPDSPVQTFDYGLSLLIRGIRDRHAELVGDRVEAKGPGRRD